MNLENQITIWSILIFKIAQFSTEKHQFNEENMNNHFS